MKISVIGGGNMGCAVAYGAAATCEVTVINRREQRTLEIMKENPSVHAVTGDFSSLAEADIVLLAVKPHDVKGVLDHVRNTLGEFPLKRAQVVVSVAAGISLAELRGMCGGFADVFYAMPNIAANVKESMTYIASECNDQEYCARVLELFGFIGKVEMLDESRMPAAMALCSCGTAFAFRYIRACMEGGVELGLTPGQAMSGILQTLRGAVAMLEASGAHPEAEIDKVTTAGGLTIKGLNEMEHCGFSSSVIRGLKATAGR